MLREMEELEESGLFDILSNRQKLYSKMDINFEDDDILNILQEYYKRIRTMESAKELCQHILDTDSVDTVGSPIQNPLQLSDARGLFI